MCLLQASTQRKVLTVETCRQPSPSEANQAVWDKGYNPYNWDDQDDWDAIDDQDERNSSIIPAVSWTSSEISFSSVFTGVSKTKIIQEWYMNMGI